MLTKEQFELATKIDDAYVIYVGSSENYRDVAFTLFKICDGDIDRYEALLDKSSDYFIEEEFIIDFFKCNGDIDKYEEIHPID